MAGGFGIGLKVRAGQLRRGFQAGTDKCDNLCPLQSGSSPSEIARTRRRRSVDLEIVHEVWLCICSGCCFCWCDKRRRPYVTLT